MDPDAIAAVLASLPHPERIQAIGRNASELIDRHRRIPETAGATTVQLLLHNRHGQLTHEGATTWAELLAARADQHLPGHAHTLRRIADPRP
jgi:site-specific recombinase XerD